ncbi:hypothetical protein DFH08DRAFT_161573 [Mycena albidolilacea]|uniref:Uncharacterized protein n=1 Tax=Mycena albidolilacea TaxID=1033008 RepID=A0AAD7A2D1_9AGAR|nr:hypothetical protein DFH08DRAFT_161573 [Mycena albidolilacea]
MLCMTPPPHIGTRSIPCVRIESCVARFFFWSHCLALLFTSSLFLSHYWSCTCCPENWTQRPHVRVLSGLNASSLGKGSRSFWHVRSQPLKASDLGGTCLEHTVSTFLLITLPCSYISGKYFSRTYGRNTVYLTYRRKCSHRLRLSYPIVRAIVRSHPRLSAPGGYPVCIHTAAS